MNKQEDRIKELEQENKELMSHYERLIMHINKLDKHAYDHTEGGVLNCCVKKEFFESSVEAAEQTPQQSLANIKADAIQEFKAHVKSGLKVLNEPSWHNKRELVIDDNTYIEIMLSEFDDYANQLREQGKQ